MKKSTKSKSEKPMTVAEVLAKTVACEAEAIRKGESWLPRRFIEYYIEVREDPKRSRAFLEVLADLCLVGKLYPDDKPDIDDPAELAELRAGFVHHTNHMLEMMTGLTRAVEAVELLRSQGR